MRFSVLGNCKHILVRGAALAVLGGLTAGCSSGTARFTDGLVTASTKPSQQRVASQPDLEPAPAAEETYSMSDARSAAPVRRAVQRSTLPPVAGTSASSEPFRRGSAAVEAVEEPVRTAAVTKPSRPSLTEEAEVAVSKPKAIDPLSRAEERDANIRAAEAKIKYSDTPKPIDGSKQAAAQALKDKPAPQAATKANGGGYTVQAGDTLLGIARRNGVSASALRAANGLDGDNVRLGQTLKIPAAGAVVAAAPKNLDPTPTASTEPVKKKELAVAAKEDSAATVKPVAYTPPANKAVAQAEQEDDSAAPSGSGIGKMRWPVKGRVVSTYGKGSGNGKDGIDIQVPEGTAVKAAENGVVIYAGNGLKDFGNTVLVRHDNGLVTVYGHANTLNVKRGQKVKRGEQIATSGMSGATEAPKLHFEVRKDAAPVDPSTYLE